MPGAISGLLLVHGAEESHRLLMKTISGWLDGCADVNQNARASSMDWLEHLMDLYSANVFARDQSEMLSVRLASLCRAIAKFALLRSSAM